MSLTTSPTGSPAFFGRVPPLLDEQARFAAALSSLRELCAALEVGALPAELEPPRLVEELGRMLTHHREDAEEWLRTVASHRRDLLPAVVDMRTDHAALSQALSDLRLVAADPARWVELPPRVTSLLAKMESHRQVEADLVQEAVTVRTTVGSR
jgi:hypothetical protein